MKHLLLTPALMLSFALSGAAQSKTSKEINGLVGPVHTVATTFFTVMKTGETWTEGTHHSSLMTYDEKENDGRFASDQPVSAPRADCSQKFDAKGHLTEVECPGTTAETTMKWSFRYDDAGNKIEDEQRDGAGKLVRRNTQTFDEKRNLTGLSSFNSGDELYRKLAWIFDEKGNLTEFTESLLKDGEMKLFQRIVSTFDDRNNVITRTQYGNPEGTVSTQFFSYEFDARGNWIRSESAMVPLDSPDLNFKTISIRVITYYEK